MKHILAVIAATIGGFLVTYLLLGKLSFYVVFIFFFLSCNMAIRDRRQMKNNKPRI